MILKKIFFSFFLILDKVIPKDNIILFSSFKEMTDNSFAIYDYLKKNNYDYRLIWINNKKNKYIKKDVEVYQYLSFKGIYYYLRSKYIFSTHGKYTNFPKNKDRIRINLWHGMPLKPIGNLDKRNIEKIKIKDNFIISTSEYFKSIMSEAFGIDIKQVLLTGQPRNDLLFKRTKYLEKINIIKNNYIKIFIWMPTFRNSLICQDKNWSKDGVFNEDYISILPIKKIEELNKILKKKNYLLIIKLHPFDKLQDIYFENVSNIKIIKNGELEEKDEQLYSLLGSTDALITDYSSVWIDYEILDKPIFFAIHDYEEYKNSRGLLFENFTEISPYPIIENYNAFIDFLEDYENINLNNKKITDKYNKYKDNNSCKRIIEYLGIRK